MKIVLTPRISIKQVTAHPFLWDVIYCFQAKRFGKMSYCEKIVANGINLEQVISKVADFDLSVSDIELLELSEYIEKYKQIQDEAIKTIKKFLKEDNNKQLKSRKR